MRLIAFVWIIVFCVSVAGAFLGCAYLFSERTEEKRKRVAVLGALAAAFALISLIGILWAGSGYGEAMTALARDEVYTTEWAQMKVVKGDRPIFVAKLVPKGRDKALYYEISTTKLPEWDGEPEFFPPKFKVISDKNGTVYVLLPVK